MQTLNYLSEIPETIPAGYVLVHNHAKPTRHLGSRGFHAWITIDTTGLEICPCGWAQELGTHYRVAELGRSRSIE